MSINDWASIKSFTAWSVCRMSKTLSRCDDSNEWYDIWLCEEMTKTLKSSVWLLMVERDPVSFYVCSAIRRQVFSFEMVGELARFRWRVFSNQMAVFLAIRWLAYQQLDCECSAIRRQVFSFEMVGELARIRWRVFSNQMAFFLAIRWLAYQQSDCECSAIRWRPVVSCTVLLWCPWSAPSAGVAWSWRWVSACRSPLRMVPPGGRCPVAGDNKIT